MIEGRHGILGSGMDDIDRAIINEIQSDFPIESRPFKALGKRLKLSEDEILDRVKRLKEDGVIRRIGGNFNSKKLNFTSTLCAAKVPEGKIDDFVKAVNRYPGVTHNYLRNHEYNIWFTFIAENMDIIDTAIDKISTLTGVTEIRNLPAVRMFKIKVDFEV
jgi:DNA-binding Lrp family transcriptional regulator